MKETEYPKMAGIYKLICNNNGKVYIGKTVNLSKRLNSHKNCANSNKNKYRLQNAIVKHGWENFSVEILEIFENFNRVEDNDILLAKESEYIKLFNSTNNDSGYNLCVYSTDTSGKKLSDDHKEKIKKSLLGRTFSEEHKEKIRQANLGKKVSDETKEKLRQINLGKTYTEETKEKLRIVKTGVKHTIESKEKIRKANLGKKRSEETREKIRIAKSRENLSEETREKMRISKIGENLSEETREKMRQSAKKRGISIEAREKMILSNKINRLKKIEDMNKSSICS
jgi:group I intron endonuclease